MYHETKRLIKKAMLENKLVVFVGAGVSVNSGIPLWGTAIGVIKEKLEIKFDSEQDYLKIPQFYYNARGFKEYNQLIRDIFDYADKEPNQLHRKIFELKPSHIITTNYDDFLERVADENGEFLELIEKDTDIPYAKNDRLLIKMHGGFDYDNYVLKEDDYLNYSENFKLTETLIKSLIARNTVLLIGYSFNDPDTKQIFNWVKNSLGKDFQRAYMILCNEKYNQTMLDYYKHIGINLIFAERCLGDEYTGDIAKNTVACLDYFIKDEDIEDLAQKLYIKLKAYENLNYLKLSDISKAIDETNRSWRARIEGSSLFIGDQSAFDFFGNLMQEDSEYYKKIRNILHKSQLCDIKLNKHNIWDEQKTIDFASYKSCNKTNDFEKMSINGNYLGLKSIVENINIYDSRVTINEKFNAAYYYYKTNQTIKSVGILKEISKLCKRRKNYLWHFICEFNIKHLGKQDVISGVNRSDSQNLQEIIFKYNLYTNEDNFLLEISNFSLFHRAYYKVVEMLKKVETDIFTGGIQEIHKLEYYVLDIYNYMQDNFLMVEKYSDVKSIFENYFKASVISHFTPICEKPSFLECISVRSYSTDEISKFAILCAIEYGNYAEIISLFSDYTDKYMTLSSDAMILLIKRVKNYLPTYEAKLINFNYSSDRDLLNRIVLIATKSIIDKENFSILLNELIKIFVSGNFENKFITLLNNLVARTGDRDINVLDSDQLIEIINEIIHIQELGKYADRRESYNSLTILFNNILEFLNRMRCEILFDETVVNKLISGKGTLQFLFIYKFSNDVAKKNIEEYIRSKMHFDTKVYLEALNLDIIKPSIEVESSILVHLEDLQKNKISGVVKYPGPYEIALNNIMNLKLNDNLIGIDKFAPFLTENDDIFSFLNDIEKFDYDNFQLKWIIEYGLSKKLMKSISNNKEAKANICEKFKEKHSKVGLNKSELDIYFEYFA